MLCDNCKQKEANIKYSENINGIKREMHLCEECSKKLGITDKMDFKMQAFDLSSFFGSFLEDFSNSTDFMPLLSDIRELQCNSCGTTFDDIINTGKYGCANCYDVFEDKMDPILKKLQGANRHVGRLGKISNNKFNYKENIIENNDKNIKANKLDKLKEKLKQAIKEERYEDAAKLRDSIKLEEDNKKEK